MLIGGKRVNDKAPRDRNLAMVFQNYALYPHLSVFENIAFPLRLQGKHSDAEIRKPGRGCGRDPRTAGAPRPQARQPLRWPAPAGRDGPRDRPAGRRVPVRRAAVEPRCEAARPDAHRDPAPAASARRHDRLRHPRPDRGDDPRRPGRRAAKGRRAAGREPARALRAAGQPVRGRVHRLAADELRARPGQGRHASKLPFVTAAAARRMASAIGDQTGVHRRVSGRGASRTPASSSPTRSRRV